MEIIPKKDFGLAGSLYGEIKQGIYSGVQCEMSRSNQFYIMLSLLREGAITFDDLEDFSDDLKDMMKRIADN